MATLACFARVFTPNIKQFLTKTAPIGFRYAQNKRLFSICSALRADRLYTDKHEWITVDNSVGTVGISDYAQEKLGDIVYVQLPEDGAELDQDDECGALESVKAASELYTPVSGTITAGNMNVVEETSLINTSPYEDGWLFKIKLSKPEELDGLMSEEKYQEFLESEN